MKQDNIPTSDSRQALILVPKPAALIQDLGPFHTGQNMETDILPGSALVCMADENGAPRLEEDGMVRFAFEGNANGAVNLTRFHERCLVAAGRLGSNTSSIAYGRARPEDLVPVARFDLLRFVFGEVLDAAALEAWAGEEVSTFLPPAEMITPTAEPTLISRLSALPMRAIAQGQKGIFAWLLMDGTILAKEGVQEAPVEAWRPGDPGLEDLLSRAGLAPARRLCLLS